jgi:Leucine-rich repeat (LRR) protein
MVHDMHTYKDAFPSEEEWNNSLTALPSPLVTSLSLYSWAKDAIPAAISTLTALTRLDFVPFEYAEEDEVSIYPHWNDSPRSISVRHLAPLTRLRQLSFYNDDTHGDAEELLSLPALAGLQALQLRDWRLQAMPRALSALTRLTTLNLSKNLISTTAPLATLQHLQQLDLSHCSLTAVPQQLSGLTALTRLDLAWNDLQSGWQHLLPLQHLQDLNLSWIHESNLFSRTHFLEKI